MIMKRTETCLGCGKLLTKENTYSGKGGKLYARCKVCKNKQSKEHYKNNKERHSQLSKIKYRELKIALKTEEERERRKEIEFLEEWNRLEEERLEKEKAIEKLKVKHKCYECKWGKWIKSETKFICLLPKCWKESELK